MAAIKQSFSWWCYENRGYTTAELLKKAKQIGYLGVDLIAPELWPAVTDVGLGIAAVSGHASLGDGLNKTANAGRIEKELRENIERAVEWKIPVLICFSGNRDGLDDDTGLKNCAETLARVAALAEQAGVQLAVELLNSKIDHADYQCDRTSWGLRLCERVGSSAVSLLYDIYHMQIMEGDLIRTIGKHHARFSHYHTAGNPARGPTGPNQEINYPAVYRAISATGYAGFVGHEFIPAGDPVTALREAFAECRSAVI